MLVSGGSYGISFLKAHDCYPLFELVMDITLTTRKYLKDCRVRGQGHVNDVT